MENTPILSTERLHFRKLRPEDLPILLSTHQHAAAMPFALHIDWNDIELLQQTLLNYDQYNYGLGRWGVEMQDQLIGWCGLHFNLGDGSIDLAMGFLPTYLELDVATEAAYACLFFGFEKLRLFEIHCRLPQLLPHFQNELRSLGLLPKLDFEQPDSDFFTLSLQKFQFKRKHPPLVSIF